MLQHFRPATVLILVFTALLGLGYPLAMTGVGQLLFPSQANGSPVYRNGERVGSAQIGQNFSRPEYFWGRPSAAGKGYDARNSSGSNLGPTSKALAERVAEDAKRYAAPIATIPPELLAASGSGLDPHISPAAARFQVARIAAARHLPPLQVETLIAQHTEEPALGLIGEARVNVLLLNLALDALPAPKP
ncbi:MAG: potassium-transporting ATPase subunit KdpC [Parvularculaceae bacterium]|nr:potassium-transporting ATPase subunit KdpC [Parvularculaceae bacterium]